MTEKEFKKLIGNACHIEDVNEHCQRLHYTYEDIIRIGVRNYMNWLGYDID